MHPGITALIDVARIGERERIDTWNVSFGLVPRINAAGRVWKPRAGVELLLATDNARAAHIAHALDKANKDRMDEEASIFQQADALIHKSGAEKHPVIVLSAPDWHVGVVGIVASRIMERYGRPVVLLSSSHREEDTIHPEKGRVYQGSARSIQGFDLLDAIRRCDDLLIAYGGHAMAAGLRLFEANIPAVRERLGDCARKTFATGFLPSLFIDCVLPFDKINLELLQQFRVVEPCGVGNTRPVFAGHGATVIEARPCGAGGKHTQLKLGQGTTVLDAISFNGADKWKAETLRHENIDIAFTIKEDNYQNRKTVKLNIIDLRSAQNGNEGG
jgi:single-stranded-DNA-specific exonuclease